MILTSLDDVRPGMALGVGLHNREGHTLLGAGVVLTDEYIGRLRELGWGADRIRAELADLLDQGWRERRVVLDGTQLAQEELVRGATGLLEVPW